MKNLFIILLIFTVLGCKRESIKKAVAPIPVKIPLILVEGKSVYIDSLLLRPYNGAVLKEFYIATGYKSAWQSKKDRQNILEQLSNADEEGLPTSNYNLKKLYQFEKKFTTLNTVEKAKYDILLTHSLQKYIAHISTGRFNALHFYKNWDLKEDKNHTNEIIANLINSDSLVYKMEQLIPNHVVYSSLKKALKLINSFPDDDFLRIPFDSKIVLNDTNPAITDVKKRLIYWNDMGSKDSISDIYDTATYESMKKFQARHGLLSDGVIGKGTIDALNFSKYQRKKQILANLERWKWLPADLGSEYIIINIPDYKLTVVKDNDTVRTYKIIVGRDKRPTPVLSSNLTHVVLNPTWTVPPTILREDVIPAIARNRNYLNQNNIKIYDSGGKLVSSQDWKISNAKGYRYVQSPGSSNSLGMVKVIFPNRFSIYLHDTNHRDFFGKQKRSLSSGCVRVQNPLELAEYLLNNREIWTEKKIREILQEGKTKYIKIDNQFNIHILYWTAWSENNDLIFRDDIYSLDDVLSKKL